MKKIELFVLFAQLSFIISIILMSLITFNVVKLSTKQFLAPIAITFFGLSMVLFLLFIIFNLKNIDFEYFRNVMIGIAGGLAVWVFSTINLNPSDGLLIGLNKIMVKVGISLMILYFGYVICRKKKETKNDI